ncbi:MAG: PEGA domain-containing protein [Parcubacteria group bacterium]|nr:PEGA domain-containing protein [Parcubacteria group bacterium]
MTLTTRRILYSTFAAIFFLAAPPLVLYTAGFRYDFEYRRVVETGSLVVKSDPSDATVRLNGELRKEPTPTIINTILPGKIKLLVEKEGYHSWEKEIEIKPRVTSFEEDITLFAQSAPEALAGEAITQYWWNRNQDKFAYATTGRTLRLFNALNQKDELIANLGPIGSTELSWSEHEDAFFFTRQNGRGKEEVIIVNTGSPERIIPVASLASTAVGQIQWDPKTRASLYARTQSGAIVRLNYLLATEYRVADGPIASFLAEKNRIIMISEPGSGNSLSQLSWINPTDQGTVHLVPGAPRRPGYRIIPTNSQYIALARPETRELIIIDPTVKQGTAIAEPVAISGVVEYVFAENGSAVVYSDGFGMYARSLTTPLSVLPAAYEKSTLVTRYSKPVRSLAVSADGRHVFYMVSGELRVNEVAAASDPRSTTLLSLSAEEAGGAPEISGLRYDELGNALTFIGANGTLQTLALSREDNRAFPFGN